MSAGVAAGPLPATACFAASNPFFAFAGMKLIQHAGGGGRSGAAAGKFVLSAIMKIAASSGERLSARISSFLPASAALRN